MFIEPSWQESIVALLIAINTLSGASDRGALTRPLSVADVAAIARSLKDGNYRAEHWFSQAPISPRHIPPAAPPVSATQSYDVMTLGIEPSGLATVSSKSGGIVFEDPFYGLLASYNLGRSEPNLVDMRVSSRDQAWAQRQRIVDELKQGIYRPETYFDVAGPAIPGTSGKSLRAATLSGDDLGRLVFNGRTEVRLDREPQKLYGLYRYVAP